ncbi:hypothetical protein Tco_0115083 [Tanacetum coccineum]
MSMLERVLDIVSLFNIPGVSHDAVMLRVFPITLTGAAKRWVDRLPPGTVDSWDLLKKAFIQRVLGEYYQKARILELKRRYFEDYCFDNQYAIGVKRKWDWGRDIRGRVFKELDDLVCALQNVVVSNNCRDRWRWTLFEDGEFKVKDLSRMVEEKIQNVESGSQETL